MTNQRKPYEDFLHILAFQRLEEVEKVEEAVAAYRSRLDFTLACPQSPSRDEDNQTYLPIELC